MNRLLFETHEVDARGAAVLSDRRAAHIYNVLRAVPGMRLRAGIIDGPAGEAEIISLEPPTVALRFAPLNGDQTLPATPTDLDLLLALPRPKALKRLWPQLSALGVRRVMVTHAERVERCYFSARPVLPEYVRPLLIEGAVQAGVTRLPEFAIYRRLSDALAADRADPAPVVRWLGQPGPAALPPSARPAVAAGIRVAIGPEGGWTPAELLRLGAAGYLPVSLGPCTLRCDTACIALLALALSHLQKRTEA